MALAIGSDAACLVAPQARSRAGGYHCFSGKAGAASNGPILTLAKVAKNAMAPAPEAELGALRASAKEAAAARSCLEIGRAHV